MECVFIPLYLRCGRVDLEPRRSHIHSWLVLIYSAITKHPTQHNNKCAIRIRVSAPLWCYTFTDNRDLHPTETGRKQVDFFAAQTSGSDGLFAFSWKPKAISDHAGAVGYTACSASLYAILAAALPRSLMRWDPFRWRWTRAPSRVRVWLRLGCSSLGIKCWRYPSKHFMRTIANSALN